MWSDLNAPSSSECACTVLPAFSATSSPMCTRIFSGIAQPSSKTRLPIRTPSSRQITFAPWTAGSGPDLIGSGIRNLGGSPRTPSSAAPGLARSGGFPDGARAATGVVTDARVDALRTLLIDFVERHRGGDELG